MNLEELLAFAGRNPILSVALVGLTLALIYTEIARLFRGYKVLKPAGLTQLVNQQPDTLMVDMSAIADFDKGHIAGSRNVIPSQFDPNAKPFATAKQSPVILICRNGMASSGAARRLKKEGFEQVYLLDGGIVAWQQAGLPLVKGRN
ncbi:MAG: rhodanese-like domain-containing protein [Xanthomonadaceae bacterium]|nr:rhodanese-like domain-containing protein [Xanthomonadaceae bacterium]